MRRVVVTGIGIVSCIGNDQKTVIENLKKLNSGISKAPEYEEFSFRSLVHGKPVINLEEQIDRRLLRFMGDGAAYNYISMKNAIKDSDLKDEDVSNSKSAPNLFKFFYHGFMYFLRILVTILRRKN